MMQAGTYFIGDLSNVMCTERQVLATIQNQGTTTLKDGRQIVAFEMMYGCGVYVCFTGDKIAVNDGIIGCIRLQDIRDNLNIANLKKMGAVVEFEKPFVATEQSNALVFGNVKVHDDFDALAPCFTGEDYLCA